MEILKGYVYVSAIFPFRMRRLALIINLLSQLNVLINNETPPRACIADFGLSAVVPSKSSRPTLADAGGTAGYMAPELFSEGAKASKQADMYAFGIVAYEVITGTRPFGDRKLLELQFLTLQGSRPPMPEDPAAAGFCQGTWEFTESCWVENPGQRPMVRQAVEHFEHAARTSTVVDPGPTVLWAHELIDPTKPEDSSRNFCQCQNFARYLYPDGTPAKLFTPPSTSTSRGMFQQTAYATRVLVSNRAVPVPTLHARGEPNPLRRMFHRLIPPRPAPRLGPSP